MAGGSGNRAASAFGGTHLISAPAAILFRMSSASFSCSSRSSCIRRWSSLQLSCSIVNSIFLRAQRLKACIEIGRGNGIISLTWIVPRGGDDPLQSNLQ
jgi:hypothetical protein